MNKTFYAVVLPVLDKVMSTGSRKDRVPWLHVAAENGWPTLANRLIVSEADMSATVEDQVTAFHWACGLGHIDATRLMTAHGANINQPDITQHSIAPASVRIPLSLAQGVALIGYGLATLVRTFKQDHARHPGI